MKTMIKLEHTIKVSDVELKFSVRLDSYDDDICIIAVTRNDILIDSIVTSDLQEGIDMFVTIKSNMKDEQTCIKMFSRYDRIVNEAFDEIFLKEPTTNLIEC